MGTELNFHLVWRWSFILASYCCFSLALCKSHSAGLYVADGRCQRRGGAGAKGVWKTRACRNRTLALRLTMALPDRSWNLTRTRLSDTTGTRTSWNRHVDGGARGVWRTRTWSRNRTTSLRSWNRTRTRLSDRTRTRTSWNQDKNSIASSRGVMPLNVDGGAGGTVRGAEAAGVAGGAGARGVLERKTRAWTKNRTPYSPHQDLHIVT